MFFKFNNICKKCFRFLINKLNGNLCNLRLWISDDFKWINVMNNWYMNREIIVNILMRWLIYVLYILFKLF